MTLAEIVHSFLSRVQFLPHPAPELPPVRDIDANFNMLMSKLVCPDCYDTPVYLLEGARGGISTNVYCANCGHGYNITPLIGKAEDIGVNLNYCQNQQIKARRALAERYDPNHSVGR